MGRPARGPQVTCAARGGGKRGCEPGSVRVALGRPGPEASVLARQLGVVAPGSVSVDARLCAALARPLAPGLSWTAFPTGFLSGGASFVTAVPAAHPRLR